MIPAVDEPASGEEEDKEKRRDEEDAAVRVPETSSSSLAAGISSAETKDAPEVHRASVARSSRNSAGTLNSVQFRRVRKKLTFGETKIDHEANIRAMDEQLRSIWREDSRLYGFDFERGRPLTGKANQSSFQWAPTTLGDPVVIRKDCFPLGKTCLHGSLERLNSASRLELDSRESRTRASSAPLLPEKLEPVAKQVTPKVQTMESGPSRKRTVSGMLTTHTCQLPNFHFFLRRR